MGLLFRPHVTGVLQIDHRSMGLTVVVSLFVCRKTSARNGDPFSFPSPVLAKKMASVRVKKIQSAAGSKTKERDIEKKIIEKQRGESEKKRSLETIYVLSLVADSLFPPYEVSVARI